MDRRTLMGYGWVAIVSCLLVVMIMLATPFGKFIASAFRNTTEGFYQVENKVTADGNIIIGGVVFDTPDEEGPKQTPIKITIDGTEYDAISNTKWSDFATTNPTGLTISFDGDKVKINDKYLITTTYDEAVVKTDIVSALVHYYTSSVEPSA